MTIVAFVVPGVPVGKGRPKFARRGNFVSTYTPEKTASYENLVKVKAEEAMQGRSLIDGPVSVDIDLYVSPPVSWSLKKQRAALLGETFPTAKPDMDDFKAMLRKDFQPGPDSLREGLKAITAAGLTVPAAIDDYVERIRVWTVFFADKANQLRALHRRSA